MFEFDRPRSAVPEYDLFASGVTDPDVDDHDTEPTYLRRDRVRGIVADRVTYGARALARHRRDEWVKRQRIGPHALLWFYLDDDYSTPLRVATRLFLDEADSDRLQGVNSESGGVPELQLHEILRSLRALAEEYRVSPAGFDPRRHMCQRVDDMAPGATYLGMAATTVAFPDGPAKAPTIRSGVVLADGTTMLLRGGHDLDAPDLQSTSTLDVDGRLIQPRRWRWASQGEFDGADLNLYVILDELRGLHELVAESAGNDVRAAAR